MYIQIKHEDRSETHLFGVCDWEYVQGGEAIGFNHHSDAGTIGMQTEEGRIVRAVSESSYDVVGAYETIGNVAIQDRAKVVVALTDRYPWVEDAVHRLQHEEDFDGDLEVIERD